MKYGIIILIFSFSISLPAIGDYWLDLYEPDGTTPYDGHPIMVGQTLVVVVSSNVAISTTGKIILEGNNVFLGELSCRTLENMCDDSILPAALGVNEGANVSFFIDEGKCECGYSFWTDDEPFVGEWFIFDYTATDVGDPNIALYAGPSTSPDDPPFIERTIQIVQVHTRDFDESGIVNMGDLVYIAQYWLSTTCADPDWCQQADLNRDNNVDILDLAAFVEFWLEETG